MSEQRLSEIRARVQAEKERWSRPVTPWITAEDQAIASAFATNAIPDFEWLLDQLSSLRAAVLEEAAAVVSNMDDSWTSPAERAAIARCAAVVRGLAVEKETR